MTKFFICYLKPRRAIVLLPRNIFSPKKNLLILIGIDTNLMDIPRDLIGD